MFIVRLMSRCDCHCKFCLVWDEIKASEDLEYEQIRTAIDGLPKAEPVDFFGGEPTLYPRFLELARYVKERGHPVTLASHCMKASNIEFARKLVDIRFEEIRTSLYGGSAKVHDAISRHPKSFSKTLQGVQNLTTLGQRVSVTFVITKENEQDLARMVEICAENGAHAVKFSLLVQAEKNRAMMPSLAVVRDSIQAAIRVCESRKLDFTFSKMPFCFASDHIAKFVCEGEYEGTPGPPSITICEKCVVRNWCHGLEPEYLEGDPSSFLRPIRAVPETAVTCVTKENVSQLTLHDGPRLNLFRVNVSNRELLSDFARAMLDLEEKAKRIEASIGVVAYNVS